MIHTQPPHEQAFSGSLRKAGQVVGEKWHWFKLDIEENGEFWFMIAFGLAGIIAAFIIACTAGTNFLND